MINGAHIIIYTKDPEADRIFFRDALNLSFVDAGDNWLIFSLPPAEIAFHPSDDNNHHEFYFTCDNIENFTAEMKTKGVECSEITDLGWGLLSEITLPGGGRLGIYEPRHARP